MKTLTVGDLKTNFSEVLKDVQNGESIAISYGKKKKIIAYLVSEIKTESKKPKRKLGLLEGKATFKWVGDGKITEEEFLGL
jgi:antitoxin (DNA-binding transcriptional repressor) of toxin-antitoxin stability system